MRRHKKLIHSSPKSPPPPAKPTFTPARPSTASSPYVTFNVSTQTDVSICPTSSITVPKVATCSVELQTDFTVLAPNCSCPSCLPSPLLSPSTSTPPVASSSSPVPSSSTPPAPPSSPFSSLPVPPSSYKLVKKKKKEITPFDKILEKVR